MVGYQWSWKTRTIVIVRETETKRANLGRQRHKPAPRHHAHDNNRFIASQLQRPESSCGVHNYPHSTARLSDGSDSSVLNSPSIRLAGVTSKAGFHVPMPGAARGCPKMCVSSAPGRCSMTISSPVARFVSTDFSGAATKNGTPWYFAAMAIWKYWPKQPNSGQDNEKMRRRWTHNVGALVSSARWYHSAPRVVSRCVYACR